VRRVGLPCFGVDGGVIALVGDLALMREWPIRTLKGSPVDHGLGVVDALFERFVPGAGEFRISVLDVVHHLSSMTDEPRCPCDVGHLAEVVEKLLEFLRSDWAAF